jgi:hypothetical protein
MKVFWGLLILGLSVCFLLPPFQGPDEATHWLSALNKGPFSQRNSCTYDKSLPSYLEATRIIWHPDEKFDGRLLLGGADHLSPGCDKQEVSYATEFSYPAVQLSRLLSSIVPDSLRSSLFKFYLARFLGGVAFVFLFVAYWRRSADLLSLILVSSPLFMQQVFSVSGDTVVLLYVMLYMALAAGVGSYSLLRFVGYIGLCVLGFGAVSNKPTLAPVLLSLSIFEFYRRRRAPAGIHLFVGILCLAYPLLNRASIGIPVSSTISPPLQIEFILENPWGSFRALWRVVRAALAPESWTGPMGFLEAPVMRGYSLLWATVFVVLLLWKLIRPLEQKRLRLGLAIMGVLGCGFSTALVMYLVYSPVGNSQVLGVQSRYLFPGLLAAFFVIFDGTGKRRTESFRGQLLEYLPWLGAIFAALALLYRYWLS